MHYENGHLLGNLITRAISPEFPGEGGGKSPKGPCRGNAEGVFAPVVLDPLREGATSGGMLPCWQIFAVAVA